MHDIETLAKRLKYTESGELLWLDGRNKGNVAGCVQPSGYRVIKHGGKNIKAHKIVWFIHTGSIAALLDHINGMRDDNRIENLREATANQNQWNRVSRPHFVASRGKWRVKVRRYGRDITIGYFDTEEQASIALQKFKDDNDGGFAR